MEKKEPIYIQIYMYYKQLIEEGRLQKGVKLPSIRRCAAERRVSRTTVEAAYMQLAAEGYIVARAGSGFYVSEIDVSIIHIPRPMVPIHKDNSDHIKYDFSSATVDKKSFNFDIWRRAIKSALRNTERLLSYGDAQGEYDLRVALSHYVREKRGVVCTPEQIVIGAGMQTLLHLVCTLVGNQGNVGFVSEPYRQGKSVFEDRGYHVYEGLSVASLEQIKDKHLHMIYTSPSHATYWGGVMPMKNRLQLLRFAKEQQCLIIEDDYDSELNYYNRPTPSLQGLDGGRHVIYMSTFSKLLLPSLRMSFMVLPTKLLESYKEKGQDYNQTASKTEQIALCQFIREGHLEKQAKKARKLYLSKIACITETIQELFEEKAEVRSGQGGFLVRIECFVESNQEEIEKRLHQKGVKVKWLEKTSKGIQLTLSCSSMSEDQIKQGLVYLKQCLI